MLTVRTPNRSLVEWAVPLYQSPSSKPSRPISVLNSNGIIAITFLNQPSISMEFSAFTGFRSSSGVSLCPYRPSNSVLVFEKRSFHRRRKYNLSRSSCSCSCSCKLSSLRITATSANNGPADVDSEVNCDDFWGNYELVEVIGIGSRKEAVLDFCLESPFRFPSLRFW